MAAGAADHPAAAAAAAEEQMAGAGAGHGNVTDPATPRPITGAARRRETTAISPTGQIPTPGTVIGKPPLPKRPLLGYAGRQKLATASGSSRAAAFLSRRGSGARQNAQCGRRVRAAIFLRRGCRVHLPLDIMTTHCNARRGAAW